MEQNIGQNLSYLGL